MNTNNVLTIESCLAAIEIAKPLMTHKKLEIFKHNLRVEYVRGVITTCNRTLLSKQCVGDWAVQVHKELKAYTTILNELTSKA